MNFLYRIFYIEFSISIEDEDFLKHMAISRFNIVFNENLFLIDPPPSYQKLCLFEFSNSSPFHRIDPFFKISDLLQFCIKLW